MDARLDQNQAELSVLVLAELVEVLAHLDSLLDEAVEVLGNLRSEACAWPRASRRASVRRVARKSKRSAMLARRCRVARRRRMGAVFGREAGDAPPFLRMRRTLLPVTCDTWAMPCESRRMTPICEGTRPFLASLQTCSTTSDGDVLSHEGGVRRYGRADLEIPLLPGGQGETRRHQHRRVRRRRGVAAQAAE